MANFPLLCQRNQSVQYEFCACFEAAELSKRVGYTAKIIRFSYVWNNMMRKDVEFGGTLPPIIMFFPWKMGGDTPIWSLKKYTENFPLNPPDCGRTGRFGIWMFPKIMVPPNGCFIMEILINMDDLGVPSFLETTIWYIWKVRFPLFFFSTGEEMQRLARWALEEQRRGRLVTRLGS